MPEQITPTPAAKATCLLSTTLPLLRQHDACKTGYIKLRKYLGKGWGKKPVPLTTILESNGVNDALWALRAVVPEQEIE